MSRESLSNQLNERTRFRPADDVTWEVGKQSVTVRKRGHVELTLQYPEVAVWDLLTRNSTVDRTVQLLTHIASLREQEATHLVNRCGEDWIGMSLLQPLTSTEAVECDTSNVDDELCGAESYVLELPVLASKSKTPVSEVMVSARNEFDSQARSTPKPSADRLKTTGSKQAVTWAIPYVDQPLDFWNEVQTVHSQSIEEVYFALPDSPVSSGRPPQPSGHLFEFLKHSSLKKGVLLNPITLSEPVTAIAPRVIETLRGLDGEFGVTRATVTDLHLMRRIKDALPHFSLTASVLMDIAEPLQADLLNGVCTTLVPSNRVLRDLPALQHLRQAFRGKIRLLVNESCFPGCPYRVQHFHEMAMGLEAPKSLCEESLAEKPWLRLIGAWVLPQHLHLYDGLFDEAKLAGRVTLRHADDYWRVLDSYVERRSLRPDEIGGGPSSVFQPMEISEEFFAYTLTCGRRCHECSACPDYYQAESDRLAALVN